MAGAVLHSSADIVSGAPELARLTLNIAATHHDWRSGGQRLVYGGHTIGLALAQATRLLPNMVTVLGWQSCDHTGPVHESDTLYSELHVEGAVPLPAGRGGVLSCVLSSMRSGSLTGKFWTGDLLCCSSEHNGAMMSLTVPVGVVSRARRGRQRISRTHRRRVDAEDIIAGRAGLLGHSPPAGSRRVGRPS